MVSSPTVATTVSGATAGAAASCATAPQRGASAQGDRPTEQQHAARGRTHRHAVQVESWNSLLEPGAGPRRATGVVWPILRSVDKQKARSYMSHRFQEGLTGRARPAICRMTYGALRRPATHRIKRTIAMVACSARQGDLRFGQSIGRSSASSPRSTPSTRSSPSSRSSATTQLQGQDRRVQGRARTRARRSTICSSPPSPRCARRRKRTLGMRHFDVQLIGGMVLNERAIAEMKTGEGKTLVATLADLSQRADRQGRRTSSPSTTTWSGATPPGWARSTSSSASSTGIIVHGMTDAERKASYAADVTYGTNNEFGFDYLRDNMKYTPRPDGAARPRLRHRRRSGLDPHRRSAHAADHFRPVRRPLRALREDRRDHPDHRRRRFRASTRSSAR